MPNTDFLPPRTTGRVGLPPPRLATVSPPEVTPPRPQNGHAVSHAVSGAIPGERLPDPLDPHAGVRSPTKSDSAIGRKIRELRRARVITQKDLATMVGVTGAQLHRYEMGTTRVAASRLIAIAEALGVHADALMGSTAPPERSPTRMALADGDDDIIELIHVFSSIAEQKNRSAIIAVARMLAAKAQGAHNEP
jgi:transcriptional regulator with XRE-family HTH domain